MRSQIASSDWIVCGFFTPDYRHWAERLAESLKGVSAPYHLLATEKLTGGWERNTMQKPHWVQEAMALHPDQAIIFLDADCIVHGDLSPLARIECDIGAFVGAKLRKHRFRDRLKYGVRSGTMLLQRTENTRKLVQAWLDAAKEAGPFDVDQAALMLAMTRVPGLRHVFLDVVWCATEGDKVSSPVIEHSAASRGFFKISRLLGRQ